MAENIKAKLILSLTDEIPAYALETVLDVINDTYTSLRWLELAEEHSGNEPYGDSKFEFDEFLMVSKVEIGTPNSMILHGLYDSLFQTILYLGISGVIGIASKSVAWGLDSYNKWLDAKLKALELKHKGDQQKIELEKRKLLADVQKAELENEKLRQEINALKSGDKKMETIIEKSKRLNSEGKVSDFALEYKENSRNRIKEKLEYPILDQTVIKWELIPE